MFGKNNFFIGNFTSSNKYKINKRKTKKIFDLFLKDWKNGQIPLLQSYEKNYELYFSKQTVSKFSKYKNIVIIGMGGSILGTKSIYSFFKNKTCFSKFNSLTSFFIFSSSSPYPIHV